MKRSMMFFMVFVLILTSGGVGFGQKLDYESSFAKSQIEYMKNKGILSGYPDGTFKPNNNMSKSEFYKVINTIMGFTEKKEASFQDVNSGDWYYDDVLKGVSAKYITPGLNLKPRDNITRGEVVRIISLVLDIEENEETAKKFQDYESFPENLRGQIGGLVEGKTISGYPDGTFRPNNEITRAEVVMILHNAGGEIVNNKGTISTDIKGNCVVNTEGVNLKNMVIDGDLYLTAGIGEGDVTLDNVEVKGEVNIKGGGPNSIVIKNSKINKLSINKESGLVRVVLEKSTAKEIKTNKESKLELSKKTKVDLLELSGQADLNLEEGTQVEQLNAKSKDVKITSAEGSITNFNTENEIKYNGKSVKTGAGLPLELASKPVVPAPVAPAPVVPTPVAPVVPEPKPAPVVPAPVVPAPVVPAPVVPTPVAPAPVVPAPVAPEPVVPAPEPAPEPAPVYTEIANIEPSEDLTLKAGDELTVSFNGPEGGQASFNIQPLTAGNSVKVDNLDYELSNAYETLMVESEPGFYYRTIPIPERLKGSNLGIVVKLIKDDIYLRKIAEGKLKIVEEPIEDPEVDKTALVAAIELAEAKLEEDYTETSWAPFALALGEANRVNENEDATQEEVDLALSELQAAMNNLELKPDPEVDKTALIEIIALAEEKEEEEYTEESWAPFALALADAVVVNGNEDATQEEVNQAVLTLETAISNLELKEPEPVESIRNIKPDEDITLMAGDVLTVSFNAPAGGDASFKVALPYVLRNQVNLQANSKGMIELEPGFYYATWTIPEEIIASNLQIEVTFIKDDIESKEMAKGRLTIIEKPQVDKTELRSVIEEAEAKVEEDYTEESWTPFATALAEANRVNGNRDATQAEVNQAVSELQAAMSNLELKPEPVADKTELLAVIELAEEKEEEDYTEESWTPFASALATAVEVNGNADATQEEINQAVSALETTMDNLELKPEPVVDKTELLAAIALAEEKVQEDYTEESWTPFASALATAVEVNGNADATQEEVNQAVSALETTMNELVPNPVEAPEIVAFYHPGFIPTFGNVTVEEQNIKNAAKFDVVFHLSDDPDGTVNITQTEIVNLGERAGSIFYNPAAKYKTVNIRIYDSNKTLLHTFEDVVLVRQQPIL